MKKTLAFLTAILISAASVSCAKKSDDEDSFKSYTVEQLAETAYKKKTIASPSGLIQVFCLEPYNNSSNYLVLGMGATTPAFWTVDSSFTNFTALEIPEFDVGAQYDIDVIEDGTIVEFLSDVDYGGLPDPDPESSDYDPVEYEMAAEYTYKIKTYSIDGKLLAEADITGFGEAPESNTQINAMRSDGKIVVVLLNGTYEVFSINGNYIGELTADGGWTIEEMGRDSSGNLICAVTNEEGKMQLREINAEGKLEESSVTYDFTESVKSEILPGTGYYSLYIMSFTTVYGVRSDDASIEPLFGINKAGLVADSVKGFSRNDNGLFIICENDYTDYTAKFRQYTPVDPAELEKIPRLEIGLPYDSSNIVGFVNQFNDINDKCQIDIKPYNIVDNPEKMREDVLAGDIPDILELTDRYGSFGKVNFAEMDALCDMYEFMDKDETLDRNSFVPQILDTLEAPFDGHLYTLSNSFYLNFDFMCKTKFANDIDNWNFDAYLEIIKNRPEGMGIFNMPVEDKIETKYMRLNYYDWGQWVDMEAGTCSFNSDSFVRFLEYCNEPSVIEEEYVYEESTPEEAYEWSVKDSRKYIDDAVMFHSGGIGGYQAYLYLTKGEFNNEPLTILGYPELDGSAPITLDAVDNFAITKNSENKELAWEFIKYLCSDEFYEHCNTGGYRYGGFPATKNGLEVIREIEKKPVNNSFIKGYEDYTGHLYDIGVDENHNPQCIKIGNVTDELINEVDELIASAKVGKSKYVSIPEDVYNDYYTICFEEFDRLFHGECTAEQCAEAMQSRISILLSENR